ncbi:MAG: CDP-glycerol glycerophosphotransferase family protein [Planctomycetia bacterium]|nr:CDP-glycerol glycerophosphotransferase family protein [Planctomycetia bacterium]
MPVDTPGDGTILFVPFSKASLLETLPVARSLAARGGPAPVFYLDPKHAPATAPVLASEGMTAVGPEGAPFVPAATAQAPAAGAPEDEEDGGEPLLKSARKSLSRFVPEFLRGLRHYRRVRRTARSILDRLPRLRALLLVSDRRVGIETALVCEANARGIPSLILPFAASFPEAIAETRYRDEQVRRKHVVAGPWRTRLARRHPGWVFRHKGCRLFYAPPGNLLAAQWCGMMPRNPWTLGGGFATRMTVDSERSRAMFVEQGTPAEKMVVTGKPSGDDIARELKAADPARVRRELGVPADRRLILCSVPPLAEHGRLTWEAHWKEIEFLFRTLGATGASVVLSLHPRSDPEPYRARAAAAGAILASRRVYELIPACDIFVAAYSSTVAQAIAVHKPAVVVDFYGLGYPVYDTAPGTAVIRDRDALAGALRRLLEDPAFYGERRREQELRGGDWAVLDGGCTARVVGELLRIAGYEAPFLASRSASP